MSNRTEILVGATDDRTDIVIPTIRGLNDEHPLQDPQPGPPPARPVAPSIPETPSTPQLPWEDMVE